MFRNYLIMKKSEVYGKRVECIIGLILLIPPILGVIAFTISIFANNYAGDFASMHYLSSKWSAFVMVPESQSLESLESFDLTNGVNGSAAATSALPIYLGLMAMVGAYLIKNSAQSFFTKGE